MLTHTRRDCFPLKVTVATAGCCKEIYETRLIRHEFFGCSTTSSSISCSAWEEDPELRTWIEFRMHLLLQIYEIRNQLMRLLVTNNFRAVHNSNGRQSVQALKIVGLCWETFACSDATRKCQRPGGKRSLLHFEDLTKFTAFHPIFQKVHAFEPPCLSERIELYNSIPFDMSERQNSLVEFFQRCVRDHSVEDFEARTHDRCASSSIAVNILLPNHPLSSFPPPLFPLP